MVDLKILKEHGCSAEDWRKIFEGYYKYNATAANEEAKTKQEKIQKFVNRVRDRINNGRTYNLEHWQHYYALDLIWDEPFRQVSPTLLMQTVEKYPKVDQQLEALKSFGFDVQNYFIDIPCADGKSVERKLNIPTFFSVMVSLVRSYVTVRRAKLVNDRNLEKFFDYAPAVNVPETRAKADAFTSRANVMAQQYNFIEALNQGVLQMLLYSWCLEFTREDWHQEKQLRYKRDEKPAEGKKEGEKTKKGTEEYVVREGLRAHHPHPTRCYSDRSHSIKTLNTDTGCRWAGYWAAVLWREIKNNPDFYNLDRVSVGSSSWWNAAPANVFFKTAYPCTMVWPTIVSTTGQREDELENQYYGAEMEDKAVFYSEHREKVNPKDDGLGTYPFDIWARVVVAGDGTIIYAAPIGYVPVTALKDNGDEKRMEDASMALILAPFEALLTNLLAQYIYAAKQNLANLTLVDESLVSEVKASGSSPSGKSLIDVLRNLGESVYRGLNIFTIDAAKFNKYGTGPAQQAIFSHRFPYIDTNGIVNALRLVIDLAERVLQFSSQEVAQSATHEQTKAEIDKIHSSTTTILEYTGLPVDQHLQAKAAQVYEGVMNYGEEEFFVEIPNNPPLTKAQLEKWGFVLVDPEMNLSKSRTIPTKVNKSALELLEFARLPTLRNRVSQNETAAAMAGFFRDIINGPMAAAIGPDQGIDMINAIAELAQLPLDKPLRNATMDKNEDEIKAQMEQVINSIMSQVKQSNAQLAQEILKIEQTLQALYIQVNGQPPQAGVPGAPAGPQGAPPPVPQEQPAQAPVGLLQ